MNRDLRQAVLREPATTSKVLHARVGLVCMSALTVGIFIFVVGEGTGRPFYDMPWTIVATCIVVGLLATGVGRLYEGALANSIINRRIADCHCPWCGYDTSTLKVELCPECGRPRNGHLIRP